VTCIREKRPFTTGRAKRAAEFRDELRIPKRRLSADRAPRSLREHFEINGDAAARDADAWPCEDHFGSFIMRFHHAVSAALFLALTACGEAAAPADADAQTTQGAAATSGAVTDAERAAVLAALSLRANAQGQVENECGDMVVPHIEPVDLGSGPGRVIMLAIGGGPSAAACYGDGPLVVFMRQNNGAWGEIWSKRGGGAIILSTQHRGGADIAAGGPGFSFPVSEWNGATYVSANREVGDSALGDARFAPN
jgi:hypothetical protein